MQHRRLLAASLAAVAAVAAIFLAACGPGGAQSSAAAAPSRLLPPDTFAEVIANPAWTVINVHVPFEGAIAGTDLRVPFDQIEQRRSRLPDRTGAPIALYCMSGSMSAEAASTLQTMGYSNIVELKGGMRAWQASGRRLLDEPSAG